MAQLGEGENLDEAGVVVLEPLADVGELIFGELPVFSLGRLPVVGGHGSEHQADRRRGRPCRESG